MATQVYYSHDTLSNSGAYPTKGDVETIDSEEVSVDNATRFADSKLMVIHSMIKQIRNGTPIYRLQLPIFLIEPRSLLEKYSDFCNHLDFIIRLPNVADPLERFLGVVKFYLSGWHTRTKDIRNAFNPVIGEVFRCHYDHGDSTTYYTAEQISHHPPSTAFAVVNNEHGIALNAYIRPVIRFRGNSLDVTLQGKMVGKFRDQEEYEVGFPHILVRGVLVGALQITLSGPARLSCPQSGYYADFDFKTKGILKGKNNYVVAQIKHASSKKVLFTVEGRWDESLFITNHSKNVVLPFFDVCTAPVSRSIVAPVQAQEDNESRKIWEKVILNILSENELEALKEKTKVEEHQRELDRDRKSNGIEWTPQLFSRVDDDYYLFNGLSSQPSGKGAS